MVLGLAGLGHDLLCHDLRSFVAWCGLLQQVSVVQAPILAAGMCEPVATLPDRAPLQTHSLPEMASNCFAVFLDVRVGHACF